MATIEYTVVHWVVLMAIVWGLSALYLTLEWLKERETRRELEGLRRLHEGRPRGIPLAQVQRTYNRMSSEEEARARERMERGRPRRR